MIDTTIVRSHACSAGRGDPDAEGLGRSKGGFTTKVHAVVDALGNPLKFSLTAGQRSDITQAATLLQEFNNAHILADKGYDSEALITQLINQQCNPVIPPRKNRKKTREHDKHWYRERHLIACFFGKIKHFRRVFSRFDKKASTYAAFLNFVSAYLQSK